MELGIFRRVTSTFASRLDAPEGFALLAIGFFAIRVVARTATNEEVVPLPRPGHGIFVVGGHASRPAGDMVVKKPVVMPGDRVFGFENGQEVESLDL